MRQVAWTTALALFAAGQVAGQTAGGRVASRAGGGSLLERTAGLAAHDVTLASALFQLTQASGVLVTYSPSLLAADRRRVNCDCVELTVREALDRLLEGTPTRLTEAAGQVAVTPLAHTSVLDLELSPPKLDPQQITPAVVRFTPRSVEQVQGSVTGRVTDASTGQPLASAQVYIPSLDIGQLTRLDGRYLLQNVPAGTHTVRVELVGYAAASQEIEVSEGGAVVQDFQLRSQAIKLDEIVVTGTGAPTQRKRLGQTISTISGDNLETAQVGSNFADALYGRVAGLTGLSKAETGSSPLLLLRGTVSLSQRNQPLVYIDGVRMDNTPAQVSGTVTDRMADLNASDIDHIEIIKGAAAATLYGTEASSGVIQIFTKRGVDQAPRFNLQVEGNLIHMPNSLWPDNAQYVNAKAAVVTDKPAEDYVRMGSYQNYNLSVRGGSPAVKYFVSGRVMKETGPMPNNGEDISSLRAAFDFVHGSRLRSSVDLSYVSNKLDVPQPDWSSTASDFLLSQPGRISLESPHGRSGCSCYSIGDLLNYRFSSDAKNVLVSGSMTYDVNDDIAATLKLGHNDVERRDVAFRPEGITPPGEYLSRGYRQVGNVHTWTTTVDARMTWDAQMSERLQSNLAVGAQGYWQGRVNEQASVQDFASPTLKTLRGGSNILGVDEFQEEVINAGLFAQEQVGLDDRLFFTAGVRMDGNSAFGENFGLSTYPKVGLSWVISEYDFWNVPHVDEFRLRGAIGTSGLQPGAFDAVRTWQPGIYAGGIPRVTPLNQGNADLKPERSTEREIAFEAGLFGGRVGLETVYFNQVTTDALLPQAAAPSSGFTGTQLVNLGKETSQGVELTGNLNLIATPTWSWDMNLSYSWIDQKIVDMGPVPDFRIVGGRRWNWIAEGYRPGVVIAPVQDPNNPYTVTVPIDQLSSLDEIQANTLKAAGGGDSLVVIGNSLPTWTANASTTVRMGQSLTLRALFVAAGGFVMSNETEIIRGAAEINPFTAYKEAILEDPSSTTAEKQAAADAYGRKHPDIISNWMEDGDYVKLNELSLSYALPENLVSHIGLGRTTLTIGGRNLWKWTKYSGLLDPGSGGQIGGQFSPFLQNIDYIATPLPRRYTFGIRTSW